MHISANIIYLSDLLLNLFITGNPIVYKAIINGVVIYGEDLYVSLRRLIPTLSSNYKAIIGKERILDLACDQLIDAETAIHEARRLIYIIVGKLYVVTTLLLQSCIVDKEGRLELDISKLLNKINKNSELYNLLKIIMDLKERVKNDIDNIKICELENLISMLRELFPKGETMAKNDN